MRDLIRKGKNPVLSPANNQLYIKVIEERYGTNKSTDNYLKNKSSK